MFQTSFREIRNKLFMFNNFFFENCAVCEIVWENIVEPDRPHDNMAHAHYILDTSGYKHIHRICNNWCCSPKQWLLERVSLLTLYVYRVSFFFLPKRSVYLQIRNESLDN